jgi:hypothetical protein
LPSAPAWTLGKESFVECLSCGTRQSFCKNPKSSLCRVPTERHSAKKPLPSARSKALGKVYFLILKKSLPSARDLALGKDYFVGSKPSAAALFPLTLSISPLTRRSSPHRATRPDAASPLAARTPPRRARRPSPPELAARTPPRRARHPPHRCRAARSPPRRTPPLPVVLTPPRSSSIPAVLTPPWSPPSPPPSSGKSCNNPSFSIVIANLCSLW